MTGLYASSAEGGADPKHLMTPLDSLFRTSAPQSEYVKTASALEKVDNHCSFCGLASTVGIITQLKKGLNGDLSWYSNIQKSLISQTISGKKLRTTDSNFQAPNWLIGLESYFSLSDSFSLSGKLPKKCQGISALLGSVSEP